MLSFFFTITSCTFQQLQHSFDAEYLKRATGSTKSFNMRWIWSFLSVSRTVAIASNIFRDFLPILGCSLVAKRVALQTGNEWSIGRLFLPLRLSFDV
jgi:hypothetical protein